MTEPLEDRLAALDRFVEQLSVSTLPPTVSGEEIRWLELGREVAGRVEGRRVLVIGGDAVRDAHELAKRGARFVMACDSRIEPEQPDDGDQPRMDVRPLTWKELDPDRHGRFDLLLCNELLHRVTEPLALLKVLHTMASDGGTLLIESMMIDDPERSEYLRFVPDRYAGDPSWCFVPGRLAFRWLVQAGGFEVEAEFAEREGPRDLFPVVAGYLRATAS